MTLGPYTYFIVTSYLAAALVVMLLIGWIIVDYRNQRRRLHDLEQSGMTRRSGRSATDMA